ncbi:MAG TPA: STAS domain-containing protein [Methanoregulaceae archaeon]|nr:STAS domain-containing protein [Methanoregulaceae archaeon]
MHYYSGDEKMSVEIRIAKEGEVPVVTMTGRLDGFGSQQLDESIREIIPDDTRSVILNLAGVEYLSSAGIRVFLALKKRLKLRGGTLVLTNVGEFPRNVLEMAGFLKVFDIYPSVKEAEIACRARPDAEDLLPVEHPKTFTVHDVVYAVESRSSTPASLIVTGDLAKVLESSITKDDIRTIGFADADYSLGLGALGKNIDDAMPLLGEMITLHGSMVYVPTDGHRTPDFFTPVKDTGGVRIFTGFNIALAGQFHEIITFETGHAGGVTLAELYSAIFSFAKGRREDFRGIISLVLYGIAEGVISSEIKFSPVVDRRPPNKGSIMDPENYDEWNDTNTEPRYRGDTLVSFGIGIDFSSDLSAFNAEMIHAISYVHPSDNAAASKYLHNHGVIFRDVPFDTRSEISHQVKTTTQNGEFIDMRHLMDSTRVRKAKLGISYISSIGTRGAS